MLKKQKNKWVMGFPYDEYSGPILSSTKGPNKPIKQTAKLLAQVLLNLTTTPRAHPFNVDTSFRVAHIQTLHASKLRCRARENIRIQMFCNFFIRIIWYNLNKNRH